MSVPPFVIIGNPENRRIAFFQSALRCLDCPPPIVLSYEELLAGRCALADHIAPGAIVRLESPGENFEVEKRLLAAGIAEAEAEGAPVLSAKRLERLSFDRGRILHPRQWYLGFRRTLRHWHEQLRMIGGVYWMNAPPDIEILFDKIRCHAVCREAGLPVPQALGSVCGYDELLHQMDQTGMRRVFVKPAHGSSASGVVAFHRQGARQTATTSAELVRSGGKVRLYNSLRIRRYTQSDDIRDLIDTLARERVHVERWLPRATLDRRGAVDLRIVVIDGAPCHQVARQSRSPMTNLHLGNRRADLARVLDRLGEKQRQAIEATCRQAGALFPDSLQIGLDVLLSPGFRDHAILEINAFGDLLPGVFYRQRDTYAAQIAAMLGRLA